MSQTEEAPSISGHTAQAEGAQWAGGQRRFMGGSTTPAWGGRLWGPLARGRPAACSFEKQLPVNKCEQKFGPIFKVMSYAENMFLQMEGMDCSPLWHLGEFINNR